MYDLAPLIVTSPVPRVGTTLVQRLLCTDPQTLVYGDNAANELQTGLHMASYKRTVLPAFGPVNDELLVALGEGDVDRWLALLTPPVEPWIKSIEQAALAPALFCRDHAAALGRPRWGVKMAGWPVNIGQSFLKLLPQCRVIYVLRDLEPSLRSARTVGLVDDGGLDTFCTAWAEGLRFAEAMRGEPRWLTVRYEELLDQPQEQLQALADFAGTGPLDPAPLATRLNLDRFDERGVDGWLAPDPLPPGWEVTVTRYTSPTTS